MSTVPTIRTIRDRLVVEPIDSDAKIHSPNRFIVAAAAIDKIKRGRVLAAGGGLLTPSGDPVGLAVSVGDTVLYEEGTGKPVHSYGKQYLVLREADVIAIEKEPT